MLCGFLLLYATSPLAAATLTWDADGTAGGATGGSASWDTTSLLWNNAGSMIAWNNGAGHTALFGGTAGTVMLNSGIIVGGMTFNSSGYSINGNGNMMNVGGTVMVTTAGHSAQFNTNMTVTAPLSFSGSGNISLSAGHSIDAASFSFGKSGTGKLIMASTLTNAGAFTMGGGEMDLSGSYTYGSYGPGFSVTSGILNVTGTVGSAVTPSGQTAFSGNSVTNFSGTAYMSGGSTTFRVGEATSATVNVTAGSLMIGASSGGLVLGRGSVNARGFLNISGGSVLVTSNSNVVRIGASYLDTETAGGGAGASVMTISDTGLFDTGTATPGSTTSILLGSNLAGNTQGTGTLNLDGGTLATNRPIVGGNVGASVFNFNGGTLKANGNSMTLQTTLGTVNVRNGGAIIDSNGFNITIPKALLHSNISGDEAIDGGLIKKGTGTLTFSGTEANTFTGVTRINAGELALSKTIGVNALASDILLGDGTAAAVLRLVNSEQIADSATITLSGIGAQAGIFRINGRVETIGGILSTGGAGIVENESATGGTLTVNNSGTQTFSGILRNGSLAGTLSLTKSGFGTLILTGTNTHTGTTTINAGTLSLAGIPWTSGAVTFYSPAATTVSQAVLDVGAGGLLTLGGTVTLNSDNHPLGALITGGTLDLGAATRTFAIADSSNAAADLTIDSPITSAGGAVGLIKTGMGTMKVNAGANVGSAITINGGVLEVTSAVTNSPSAANTSVGSAATPGVLRLVSGANYSTTILTLGTAAGARGALVMQGGTLTLTTTNHQAGILLGKAGYGALMLSGGTINTNRVDSDDGTTAASISVLQVSGGILNTARYIMFRNERWEFTVTDGQVLRTGEHIALGFRSGSDTASATSTAQGAMTVAGGLVNNSGTGQNITFGQQNDGSARGTFHLNLNAGILVNNQIVLYNGTGAAVSATVNFNGGVLRSASSTTLISSVGAGGTGSMGAYVNGAFGAFAGGAVIDTNGFNSTLNNALLAPTGNGVASIPLTGGGSGYIGAPYVEISGGGGSGATASATVDLDPTSATYGQITGIIITNPGRDYSSTPTITLLGGGGSGATTDTATIAANTSGGLTKLGTGTLALSGTAANTYTGVTNVQAGQLDLSKTAGINAIAGDVTIGTGNASAVLRLTASNQMADTSVVTFNGTGANAGILRLNNQSETIGGLASTGGAGIIENEPVSAATSTLTVNVTSGTRAFSGILRNGDGVGVDGTLALVKTGAGTQVLSGVSTYTGMTTISGGTLQISSGGSTGTGAVSVQTGGILQGAGIIKGASFTAASGSFIMAGDGSQQSDYGTLTFTPSAVGGSIHFQTGSTIVLGINPGGSSDLLRFIGDESNTLLFNGNLTVTAAPVFTPTAPEVFHLLDWSGLSATPTFATRYASTGLLTGNGDEAAGLDLPDISGSGYFWDMSQFMTSGTIAIVGIPEPSRLLLLGAAAAGALSARSRRGYSLA